MQKNMRSCELQKFWQ